MLLFLTDFPAERTPELAISVFEDLQGPVLFSVLRDLIETVKTEVVTALLHGNRI